MNDKVEGIVLSIREYRENDMILHVLTKEYGIQSLVARGMKKMQSKNAGVCQLFMHGYFYFNYHENSSMHTMRTADIITSFRELREDLLKQTIASVFCEIIENSNDIDVYEDLLESLVILKRTKYPFAIAALFVSLNNRQQGIEPYVDGCVHCMNTTGICAISIIDGGFICKNCFREHHHDISDIEDLKCFRLLCRANLDQYEILEQYTDWNYHHFELVYAFFKEYSGIHLKSVLFLKKIQEIS